MALPDWVVIAGVAGGFIAPIVAVLKVRPEARKLDHEGAAAITTSASTLVSSVRDEMADLRTELREIRTWRTGLERRLRRHEAWDDHTVGVARAAGLSVADPPPLYEDGE